MRKCVCNSNGSSKCVNNYCKNCCTDSACIIHTMSCCKKKVNKFCYGCIFNTSISSYKYYERYCYMCKELYSISLNSDESFSMHHEIVEEKNLRRNGMKRYKSTNILNTKI